MPELTYCPTCAKGDSKAPLSFCSELCELKGCMSHGEALKVLAQRRNTEALDRLTMCLTSLFKDRAL